MSDNFDILRTEILKLSVAQSWSEAVREWRVADIVDSTTPATCLCTHTPIHELCYLKNSANANTALVGNVCVSNFMGLGSNKLFDCFGRISKDPMKGLNMELADYAMHHGLINEWEYRFCLDTARKRNMSGKQALKRIQINQKLLNNIRR